MTSAFDLRPFAGQQVELSITYMTDPATGGVGVFVDDTALSSAAPRPCQRTASRARPRPGPSGGPPAGSPPNSGNWVIGPKAINFFAGTSTDDTLLLGLRARADHQPRRPHGADPPRAQRIGRSLEQRLRQFLVVTGRLRPVTEELDADVVRARCEVGADLLRDLLGAAVRDHGVDQAV